MMASKEFYETFWEEIKIPLQYLYNKIKYLLNTFTIQHKKSLLTEELSDSQKQKNILILVLEIAFSFFGLTVNKTKYKIARTGVLKGVKLALCDMKCVNLNNDVIKIVKIWICYANDKKLQNEKNFLNHIIKLQNVWRMRNLFLLGQIRIFKISTISKIIHLTLVMSVPSSTILNKTQKIRKMQKLHIQPYVVITPVVV